LTGTVRFALAVTLLLFTEAAVTVTARAEETVAGAV
jgi:hypothetical protein